MIWITTVGAKAKPAIAPICIPFRGDTSNTPWTPGINNAQLNKPTPITNAPIVYKLVWIPNLKIELLALQLNPWNKRPKQSVANAIVLAVIASVCRPIKKAPTVAMASKTPWYPVSIKKSFVKIDSLLLRGFSFNKSFEYFSILIAKAGKLSVSKLINNKCTAVNGTGNPKIEVNNTTKIPAVLPDNKNWMEFLILL